tara:strand:- start:1183 stop:1362 length:180 start_codon:yes stop_codon:yes gene_type:complete
MINQPKKVYKNSECKICNVINSKDEVLKLKKHPLTGADIIICKDCFSELYLKGKRNENG